MNLYGFASGDPVNFSDPFGLCAEGAQGGDSTKASPVQVCQDQINVVWGVNQVTHFVGLDHMWFRIDGEEFGLGAEGAANPPGAGPYVYKDNMPLIKTAVVDHSNRHTSSTVCTPLPNVQSACARRMLKTGETKGRWLPMVNDCRTFAFGVIRACSAPSEVAQRDMTAAPTPRRP
jgi:hypothetical protein